MAPKGRSWSFLLQPWRYDFEYSRAWRELDFPLYGLVEPKPTACRMGGKGRGGFLPPRPVRYLPAGLWTKLTHLEVIEEGPGWLIDINTTGSPRDPHPSELERACERHARHGKHKTEPARDNPVLAPHELLVDGNLVQFEGAALDTVWVGMARTSRTTIRVIASNINPNRIALGKISDPARYLRGQRAFMRS